MISIMFVLLVLIAMGTSHTSMVNETPSVSTSIGTLKGKLVTIDGNNVHQFLGVSYAKPPVQSLRFQRPEALQPTPNLVRDATQTAPTCVQMHHLSEAINPLLNFDEQHKTSEDCLYVNIYVPVTNETSLPVMVWIPGEGYDFADARQFDGSYLAATGKVIVVTVQYRVGVFGFLSIDNFAPGNMGLWDQIEALKWVRNNIENFGGDANKVTVFGRFSGSMSISLLLTSPALTHQHLFSRAILMSGVSVESWAIDRSSKMSNALLETLGFHNELELLNTIDSNELLMKSSFGWRPTVDQILISEEPKSAMKNGHFSAHVSEVMLGTTEAEGTLCLLTHLATKSKYYSKFMNSELSKTDFVEMTKLDIDMYNGAADSTDWLHSWLISRHVDSQKASLEEEYINFCSSLLIKSPTESFAKILSEELLVPTFTYNLKYRPSFSQQPSNIKTAAHGDDVLLVFGQSNAQNNFTLADRLASVSVIEAFANFASKGLTQVESTQQVDFSRLSNIHSSIVRMMKMENVTQPSFQSCLFTRNVDTLSTLMHTHPKLLDNHNYL